MATIVNLAQFGVDSIGYKDLKQAMRFFGKPFNNAMGLADDNQTASMDEIISFAIGKKGKIGEWLTSYAKELGLVQTEMQPSEENADIEEEVVIVDKVAEKIAEIKARQLEELTSLIAKEVFGVEEVGVNGQLERLAPVDLDNCSSVDITKPKEEKVKKEKVSKDKTKTAPAFVRKTKVSLEKVDVLAEFDKKMAEKGIEKK